MVNQVIVQLEQQAHNIQLISTSNHETWNIFMIVFRVSRIVWNFYLNLRGIIRDLSFISKSVVLTDLRLNWLVTG